MFAQLFSREVCQSVLSAADANGNPTDLKEVTDQIRVIIGNSMPDSSKIAQIKDVLSKYDAVYGQSVPTYFTNANTLLPPLTDLKEYAGVIVDQYDREEDLPDTLDALIICIHVKTRLLTVDSRPSDIARYYKKANGNVLILAIMSASQAGVDETYPITGDDGETILIPMVTLRCKARAFVKDDVTVRKLKQQYGDLLKRRK